MKYDLNLAADYLSGDSLVIDDLKAIAKHAETNPDDMIDYVDGVSPWEKVALEFTCAQFLELVTVDSNHYTDDMKLVIDGESVSIFVDEGDDEPIHICYWHLDEVEEDASVALSIAKAINLYHTDKEDLLTRLGLEHYALGFGTPFEDWTGIELFEYLQSNYCIADDDEFERWVDCRTDLIKMAKEFNN